MKQLLFLLLFPCLAMAQYQGNAGQKITLGEQTTADGLVWRGRLADTANLLTNKLDTSVYIVLDTGTRAMWYYRASTTPKWTRLVDSLNNMQGTLAVANGGTGTGTEFTTGSVVFAGASGTYTQDNSNLFWDNTEKRLGIGTSSPTEKLHVNGNGLFTGNAAFNTTSPVSGYALDVRGATNKRFGVQNSNSLSGANLLFYNDSNGFADGYYDALNMYVQTQSGNKTIFAATTDRGAYNVQVNGTGVWGEGAYTNGSDANVKENIFDLDSSLNIVNNLKPVIFNYINPSVNLDTKHLGFIAQDVYQTLENKDYLNSIVRSDGDTLSIAYSNLIPLLTKAIQEQNALIKALEQRILTLENK